MAGRGTAIDSLSLSHVMKQSMWQSVERCTSMLDQAVDVSVHCIQDHLDTLVADRRCVPQALRYAVVARLEKTHGSEKTADIARQT